MPLSEHEQQILAEIERQLADEDPRFAARTQGFTDPRVMTRRRWMAAALFVVGLVVTAGLAVSIVFGLIGFACMFAGLVLGGTTMTAPAAPAPPRPPVASDD